MLRPLWRQGFRYFKVGVVLDDLRDAATEPRSLFPTRDPATSARLMAALDAVNARYGRGALRPLATGLAPASPRPRPALGHAARAPIEPLHHAGGGADGSGGVAKAPQG